MPQETDDTTLTTPKPSLLEWMSGGNMPKPSAPATPTPKQPSQLLEWMAGKTPAPQPKTSGGADALSAIAKQNPSLTDILSQFQPSHDMPAARNPIESMVSSTVKPADTPGGFQQSSQSMQDIGLIKEDQSKEAIGFAEQQKRTKLAADALSGAGTAPTDALSALMKFSSLSPATAFGTRSAIEGVNAATLHLPDILAPGAMGELRKDISTGNPTADWLAQTAGGLTGDLATLGVAGKAVKAAAPLLEGTMAGSAATFGLHDVIPEIAKVATKEETPLQGGANLGLSALTGALFHGVNEASGDLADEFGKGVATMSAVEGNAAVGVASTVAGSVVSGRPVTGSDIAESAGMGAGFGLMGAKGKEKSDYDSNLARLTEAVMGDETSKSYKRTPKVGDLISAIGKSEGWGVERGDDGNLQMAKYNGKTIAPFGLLGDTKNNPDLANDPQKAYDFMVGKLTNPKSATYVPGLVREDGTIDPNKLSALRNKWAPIGAGNDPNNKNSNWLANVQENLGGTQSPEDFKIDPAGAQGQIKEYFDKNLEKTGGDVRRAVYMTALDLHKKSYSARAITKGFDNATGSGYSQQDFAEAVKPSDSQAQTSAAPQAEAAPVEADSSQPTGGSEENIGSQFDEIISEPSSIAPEESARTPLGDTQQIVNPEGQRITVPTATQDATEPQQIETTPYEPDPLLDPSTRDNGNLARGVEPQSPEQAVLAYFTRKTGEQRFNGTGAHDIYPAFTPDSFYKDFYDSNTGEASDARRGKLILSQAKGGKSLDAMAQEVQEQYPEAFGDFDSESDRGAKVSGTTDTRAKDAILDLVNAHMGKSHRAMRDSMESDLAEHHPEVIDAKQNEETQRLGTEAMNDRAYFGEEPVFSEPEQRVYNDTSLIDIPDAIPDHIAAVLEHYMSEQTGQIDHERLMRDVSLSDEHSTGKLQQLYADKEEIQRPATTTTEDALPAVYSSHQVRSDLGHAQEGSASEGEPPTSNSSEVNSGVFESPSERDAYYKSLGTGDKPSWGDEHIASAKAKWEALNKEQSGTLGVSIFADPRRIAAAAEFMAGHVANGIHAVGDFAKKALEEFGEAVLPHIAELYSRTREHLTSEGRADLAAKMSGERKPPVTPEGQLFEASEAEKGFGIRHQDIDARSAEAGQPIIPKEKMTSDEAAHQMAVEEIKANPSAGRELVDRLEKAVGKKNEAPVLGMEKKLLGLETQARYERRNSALAELNNAKPDELEKAQAAFDLASKDYTDAEGILKRSGSLSGKSLQEQKVRNANDFSLENMTAVKTEAVNHGVDFKERRPLTAEEANEVKAAHEADVNAGKAVEAHQGKVHDAAGLEYFNKLFKDFVADAKEARAGKKKYVDFATEQANKARARIKERQSTLRAVVLPVQDLADYAIIGGEYLAKGISAISDWSRSMVAEFGEKIRPHLDQIYEASKTRDEANVVATGGKLKAKNPADILAGMDPHKLSGSDVFSLARARMSEGGYPAGKEGFDMLMKTIHEDIREVMPGVTEREVRDAFSGYGKVAIPSKDEDLRKLREFRSLGQLTSKVEDANNGNAPKRSGIQRDAPTQDVRDKMKELEKAMRDNHIEARDPERQIKTSLDAAKTRLSNQIEDLQRQIDTGEKNPARKPLQYDAEAKALLAKRDALKKQLDDVEGKIEGRSNAQKLATYKKAIAKNIETLSAKIAAGDYTRTPKNKTILDTEGLHLQAVQESLREQFKVGLEQDRLKNRSALEKVIDHTMKGRVLSAISSPLILLKLGTAVAVKTITEPVKEVFGAVIGKIIPELANRAPIEGGFSLEGEKAALKAEFTVGMTAAWNKAIHMKDSDINILYGKSKAQYGTPSGWDRVFYIHDAFKEPLVQAVFARSYIKLLEDAKAKNSDNTFVPDVEAIGKRAMEQALRAKFQQDNFVSRAHANILHILMRDKTNPVAGKLVNLFDKILLPVTKTPTNIFGELNEHLTGLISGSIRAIAAYRAGIENLTPENADLIMRKLKNGTLGAAVLALGFTQYDKKKLPALLAHTPAATIYDLGVDIGARLNGIEQKEESLGSATLQSLMTLTQTLPYADFITRIAPALRPGKGLETGFENWTGELSKSILVPGVVQDVARVADQKQGTGAIETILKQNTTPRKPEDWLDHIKTGIPGLREQVPEKEEKVSGTRRHRR